MDADERAAAHVAVRMAGPDWPSVPLAEWSDVPGAPVDGWPSWSGPEDGDGRVGATSIDPQEPGARESRATRRTLQVTAGHRFASWGYFGTSLADVLTAASQERREAITTGALSVHFASKHDLAQAVVDEAIASWQGITERITAQDLEPLCSVLLTFDAAVAMTMYDPVVRGLAGCARITRRSPGRSSRPSEPSSSA